VKYKNFNFWLIVGLIDRVQALEIQTQHFKLVLHNHLKWHKEHPLTALSPEELSLTEEANLKNDVSLLYL